MKRCCLLLALVLCLISLSFASAEKHSVVYFYRNYCESCTPEEDFETYFLSLTGVSLADCDFTAWNVVHEDGQKALAAAGYQDAVLPLAIVDGIAYRGSGEMNTALAEEALTWSDATDSIILYLYTPACESCAKVEDILASLPDTVTLKRGNLQLESKVVVQHMDISQNPDLALSLFETYEVPDAQRITPMVFLGKHYLSGYQSIESKLLQEVELGWASEGLLSLETESNEAASQPSILASLFAGLVAGLNTCALSMLLLFLSLILASTEHAAPPAIAYLSAKFLCYLLIGFLLTSVMQQLNPAWLRPFARILMTVLGLSLAGLNLWDAVHAHRGDLGKVRNQLPTSLRSHLQKTIRRMTSGRLLIPASILLGFVVAAGEFLCAGQLFLMQLISSARFDSGQALSLILYCLAFIAPSALVCVIVLKGKSHLHTAAFFAEHLTAVKVLTAAAMLLLIILAWVI